MGQLEDDDAEFAALHAHAVAAARMLDMRIFEACAGPHLPRQHRDRRPPWCAACRRTQTGERVPDAGR